MKMKEIIGSAAGILGLTDVTHLTSEAGTSEASFTENGNWMILLRCANLAAACVAANWVECTEVETVWVSSGMIPFANLKKQFLRAKSVISGGQEIIHKTDVYLNYLKVPNGYITLTYAYVPRFAASTDEVPGEVSEQALTYGILTEYAFASGMFNEAKIWNERFERLMFSAANKGRKRVMPAAMPAGRPLRR